MNTEETRASDATRREVAIRRTLANRPPLTPDRRARLAVLLLDGIDSAQGDEVSA